MTASDRDRRHHWAETCDKLAMQFWREGVSEGARRDLWEIAAYLREDDLPPTPEPSR